MSTDPRNLVAEALAKYVAARRAPYITVAAEAVAAIDSIPTLADALDAALTDLDTARAEAASLRGQVAALMQAGEALNETMNPLLDWDPGDRHKRRLRWNALVFGDATTASPAAKMDADGTVSEREVPDDPR